MKKNEPLKIHPGNPFVIEGAADIYLVTSIEELAAYLRGHFGEPPEASVSPVDCDCSQWAREGQALVTTHHPHCHRYDLAGDAVNLIRDLIKGIERWAGDEDGVHRECWEAYKIAKIAVWQGHEIREESAAD